MKGKNSIEKEMNTQVVRQHVKNKQIDLINSN
jgi:hypothetical protein